MKINNVLPAMPEAQQSDWSVMVDKPEAHKSEVNAMATFGNNLYTSSAKSLKIWEIDSMSCISELTEVSSVRAIKISQKYKRLIVAAERQLIVWDLVGLTKVAVYQTPNKISRIDLCSDNLLVVGTLGASTKGALLIFDLSKPLQPIEQKETD